MYYAMNTATANLPQSKRKEFKWTLFSLLMALFASAILGDSTAESLLLAHVDTRLIPTMFIVNALLLFLTSSLLISIIDRVDRGMFFLTLALVHGIALIAIRLAVELHAHVLFPALFSYAYVSKIILFLIFWTIANDLVDSRKASGQFPFIAAGGTLGAITVSFAIPWLLKVIAAENLLVVWALLVGILSALFIAARGRFGTSLRASSDKEKHTRRSIKNIGTDLNLVYREPLLRHMALFYCILFFVLINQHYTFYSQLKSHLTNAKELASFLGYFNGCSMFVTFALQVGVAGAILKKIGSTRSMLLLPAVLCLVFLCLAGLGCVSCTKSMQNIGQALFWSVVAGMGLRTAFFDSFFSPNFQVFFSSLPHDVRGRGKIALEGVVKPLAIMVAGLWLLLIAARLPFTVHMAILAFLSAAMIVQTLRIRKKYTESLTRNLIGLKSQQLSKLFNVVDLAKGENFLSLLTGVLEREEYEIKTYIIDILVAVRSKEAIDILLDYLNRCDDTVRATIISSLSGVKKESIKGICLSHLDHSDKRVTANSILALARYNEPRITARLECFLSNPDNRIRANAVIALWPHQGIVGKQGLSAILVEMLSGKSAAECASALYAIGVLRAPDFMAYLKDFAKRDTPRIIGDPKLWKQCIFCVGAIASDDSMELLLELADKVERNKHDELAASIARLFDGGYSVEKVLRALPDARYCRRATMLNALLQRRELVGKECDELLREVAHDEIRRIYRDWSAVHTLDSKVSLPEVNLLKTAVFEESIDLRTHNLVSISSLLDKSGQIGQISHRLYHANRHIRARALEVLDNVGDSKINRWALRLLDSSEAAIHVKEAALGFKIKAKPLMDVIVEYGGHDNEWIRSCAAYAAAGMFEASKDPRWNNPFARIAG